MTSPTNIQLRVARNGGANQTGGITAAYSDSCVLSLADATGVYKGLYEIYSYPSGFTVPAGWSESSSHVYYYNSPGGGLAPAITLPSSTTWGKFLLRATVNDGLRNAASANDLINSRTALSILSPSGLPDVAF